MNTQDPAADLPYQPQRMGEAAGQAVVGLVALAVVLVVSADPVESLRILGLIVLLWLVFAGLERTVRLFRKRAVVPDELRLAARPARPDRGLALSTGLRSAVVTNAVMALVVGVLFWLMDGLDILPGLMLGLAGMALIEAIDVRQWERARGLTVYTRVGTRGWRPTLPKESDKLVGVRREREADG
ncbi:MAG: hypothetical protein ACTMHL_00820 [Janibacter sp.]